MKKVTFVFAAMLGLFVFASASPTMVSRESHINYDYLMGYAGDIVQDANSVSSGALLPTSTIGMVDHATASGYYPPNDHHWNATVSWDLTQTYTVVGPMNAFSAITGGVTSITDSVEVGATSNVSSVNPGSTMELVFSLDSTTLFHLTGSISRIGPVNRNGASLYLYHVVNGNDQLMDIHFVEGGFNKMYNLAAGSYKIGCYASSNATSNEHAMASLNFNMQAVPEPSTWAGLALGAVVLIRRRKK